MRGEPYQFFLNTPWGDQAFKKSLVDFFSAGASLPCGPENQYAKSYNSFSSRFRFNEGRALRNKPVAYFSEGASLPRGQWDEETGNFYYGARYYDPKISVWLSVDPLAHEYQGLSPYNFVANNPIMLVDPDGRKIVNPYNKGTAEYARVEKIKKNIENTRPAMYSRLDDPNGPNVYFRLADLSAKKLNGVTKISSKINDGFEEGAVLMRVMKAPVINADGSESLEPFAAATLIVNGKDNNLFNDEEINLIGETAKVEFLNKSEYEITEINIFLEQSLSNKELYRSARHESGHADFAMRFPLLDWLWSTFLGNPNHVNGQGHDAYNPSGSYADECE
tara:strand:+ start:4331 stop:5335 length:1005 start_codon:yes stop_codon:yes gene_type:complete